MFVVLGNSLSVPIKEAFNRHAAGNDPRFKILDSSLGRFASTEAFAEIIPGQNDIKGKPVIVTQSLGATNDHTANDYAMELLFTLHNLKANGAGPLWAYVPFFGYSRQDRKFDGRMTSEALDAYAKFLKAAGVVGVSTFELHSKAGVDILKRHFGDDNVYNLDVTDMFAEEFQAMGLGKNCATGGPDKGAHDRAKKLAERLGASRFETDKRHESANETKVVDFNGDVRDADTITMDDMIDTGGTMANAQVTLYEQGAKNRWAAAPHGVLSNGGLEKLFTKKTGDGKQAVSGLLLTDTIDCVAKIDALRRQYGTSVDNWIRLLSVGPMLVDHTATIAAHPAMRVS